MLEFEGSNSTISKPLRKKGPEQPLKTSSFFPRKPTISTKSLISTSIILTHDLTPIHPELCKIKKMKPEMKFILKITLFLIITLFLNCVSEKEQKLELSGNVIGMETNSILLIKPNQNTRFDSILEIPVKNGKFYYEAHLKNPEAIKLAFAESVKKGAYRPMPLFLENEKINLTLYPEEEFDKNIVEGGKLNAAYKNFEQKLEDEFNLRLKPIKDSLSSFSKNDEFFSDEMELLHTELRNAKNQDEKLIIYKKIEDLETIDQHLSPKARKLNDRLKIIYDEQKKYTYQYIRNNPTIVSYYFLLEDLENNKETIDINAIENTFKILSKANPNHPYNDLASNLINAIDNIKVGKKFTDFSSSDLNGNKVKLSDKINGQIALLDLWATWCGPCIAKSRTMLPIYNEYKNKGFTIIGVAGEYKNTDRLVKFLEKEKWPWLNLVELDRKNGIWLKYGVEKGGGGIFLIDEKGTILAKDPTAKEVRKELESRLK